MSVDLAPSADHAVARAPVAPAHRPTPVGPGAPALRARHFFVGPPGDQRLYCHHPAATPRPEGCVLYVPPFAEEMNKARRMSRLQAEALAAAGYEVLRIDLRGCGDSSGDIADTRWQDWVEDVRRAASWLRERVDAPLWLWGLRAGCLLACATAPALQTAPNFLFWQPPASGKPLLQQFLRMKMAAGLLDGSAKGVMDSLRQRLLTGESVEVAGYELPADIALSLEQASLSPPAHAAARAILIELSPQPADEASPALQMSVRRWSDAGAQVQWRSACGPAFWQTTEIEDAPELLAATIGLMRPSHG